MKIVKYSKRFICQDSSSILDGIRLLNKNEIKILLVVNKTGRFLGTITDGDIRRGLVKQYNTQDSIKKVTNYKPITSDSFVLNQKNQEMIKKDLKAIPVVKKNKILGLLINQNEVKKIKLKCKTKIIIMAGGLGTRLGILTKNNPKALLKYKNKRLLDYIIEHCLDQNLNNIFISVFYLKNKIKKYIRNKFLDYKINFLEEAYPQGTIGSIRYLNTNNNFIVMNCDVITNVNFKALMEFHQNENAIMTICIKEFSYQNPYGVIESKGNHFVSFKEKPIKNFKINAGIYVFKPSVIRIVSKYNIKNTNDLVNHLKQLKYKISVFHIYEDWIDVGTNKKVLHV
jgi:dTDP-glucose pyrophosphorylase